MEHNCSILSHDVDGLAPIHHAASGNHVEVLRYLLDVGNVDPMSPKPVKISIIHPPCPPPSERHLYNTRLKRGTRLLYWSY
jgi:ankyrin repeat protein